MLKPTTTFCAAPARQLPAGQSIKHAVVMKPAGIRMTGPTGMARHGSRLVVSVSSDFASLVGLQPLGLVKAELLQLVNLKPTLLVEVFLVRPVALPSAAAQCHTSCASCHIRRICMCCGQGLPCLRTLCSVPSRARLCRRS